MKICHKHAIPVVPFGGGTSVEGQTLPMGNNITKEPINLDFSRMKKIIEFNQTDLDITVQAGLGYIELNEFLKEKNM